MSSAMTSHITSHPLLLFQWTSYDKSNQKHTGLAIARDPTEVVAQIKSQGLLPASIKLAPYRKNRVRRKHIHQDRLFLTQQMAQLLKANLPLIDALQWVQSQLKSAKMRAYLAYIYRLVHSGSDLHSALQLFPHVFDAFYCQVIALGEKNGNLAQSFQLIYNHLKRIDSIEQQVKKALVYPLFILGVSFSCILFILWFAIPSFDQLFNQLNAQIPVATQVLIQLSQGLHQHALLFML
ncbi:MAG: type II secretion system F family protein, partial [Vibrio sp.]